MRIGIVATMEGAPWGGSEALWATAAQEAVDRGFGVAVSVCRWSPAPPPVEHLRGQGVRVFVRRSLRSRLGRLERRLRSPFASLARFAPDVVCISQGGTYEFDLHAELLRFLGATRVPYVIVCQCSNDAWVPWDSRRARAIEFFRSARRVVFVAHENRQSVERQLATSLANAVVLRNPVNLKGDAAVPWPGTGPAHLASVARLLARDKGQDVLLETLGTPAWRKRDWRLSFYGDGPDRAYLEALARHCGIVDRVTFSGFVSDVRSIWADHHVLVLASRAEGTPLVLVEAMLCGRPAVVTDVGGNAEWVTEGHDGFIAEAPTARSFGAALERAWAARSEWEQMGESARQRALARADPSPGRTLLDLLGEAARGGSVRP